MIRFTSLEAGVWKGKEKKAPWKRPDGNGSQEEHSCSELRQQKPRWRGRAPYQTRQWMREWPHQFLLNIYPRPYKGSAGIQWFYTCWISDRSSCCDVKKKFKFGGAGWLWCAQINVLQLVRQLGVNCSEVSFNWTSFGYQITDLEHMWVCMCVVGESLGVQESFPHDFQTLALLCSLPFDLWGACLLALSCPTPLSGLILSYSGF